MPASRKIYILLLLLLPGMVAFAQQRTRFSLGTDASFMWSVKEDQRFWTFGQTILTNFNFTDKGGAYTWFCYYVPGKFTNNVTANAKSPATIPQQISYSNRAKLKLSQISIGWKQYMLGSYIAENGWNVYGLAGFGLLFGRVDNTQSGFIDSSLYTMPVLPGRANFKRMTYDLGLGLERPAGGDIYFYGEGKVFIPSTDYPSGHLLVNNDAPLTFYFNIGVRVLFD